MYTDVQLPPGKKIYFASDFHLGTYPLADSLLRERRVVNWLEHIRQDAAELYLMGDVFDFWFEYATVVPKGYIRFLGKLAELADQGVRITFFKGNHDMWMFGYLQEELGAGIVSDELLIQCNGHLFYLHHGDGLGPGDHQYKLLKKVFRSRFSQWLFARLHPNLGIGIARRWSRHSRIASGAKEEFKGAEQEWLVAYAEEFLREQRIKQPSGKEIDYFVFGHRHLPLDIRLSGDTRYINLGEWIYYNSYAVFDGQELNLHRWPAG